MEAQRGERAVLNIIRDHLEVTEGIVRYCIANCDAAPASQELRELQSSTEKLRRLVAEALDLV